MDYAPTMYLTALSGIIHLGTTVTFLVVILTVVRRHRPDAYGGLLAWAIFSLASYFIVNVFSRVVMYWFLGVSAGVIATTSLSAVCALINAILLVRGIVAIAVPRKPDALPDAPVYR